MNIIYYHPYSGSRKSPKEWRPFYLSKSLVDEGHNVLVVSASYHHLHHSYDNQDSLIKRKEVENVSFAWIKTIFYQGNGFSRIFQMFQYSFWTFFINPKKLTQCNPDIIICSSVHPFHIFSSFRWAKKFKAKLVFEIRDPWPMSLQYLLGVSKLHPLSLMCSFCQWFALRFSDKVISLQFNLKDYLVEKGMKSDKFLYVCNGASLLEPDSEESDINDTLSEISRQFENIVMYTGSHGEPNALEYLLEAFKLFDSKDTAFVLIGDGKKKQEFIDTYSSDNIFFLPKVPKNSIQSVLSFADVCVISWHDVEFYRFGVSPNKLFDYMKARKPIVQALNCKNNQVDLAKCGLNVKAADSYEIAQAIKTILDFSEEERIEMGNNGFEFMRREHDFNFLAKKLVEGIYEKGV